MGIAYSTAVRSDRLTAIVTAAGSGAKMKFYNGTQPAAGAAPGGTLLATVTFGSSMIATGGSVSSGVLTFGAVSQTSSGFTSGTPTFIRITTSGDTFIADINIGSGGMTFSGSIATSVDITVNTCTITEGNA